MGYEQNPWTMFSNFNIKELMCMLYGFLDYLLKIDGPWYSWLIFGEEKLAFLESDVEINLNCNAKACWWFSFSKLSGFF